jgi:pyruvate/2-oxoacid:ferredoxin oxidoreductase alpha subunit
VTGNEALALGLIAAARLSGKKLFYSAYPITPASDILHLLSRERAHGVRTFQAEDEIAAISSCIGAAFGGAMAATGSSGPGMALKAEALGLAVMLELPMVVVNVQRGGPSTGLPTKVEQTDLLMTMFGRSGEAPMPVLAASGPGDCFAIMLEAWRIAARLMTPVMVLSDVFVANGAEPWRVPEVAELEPIPIVHPTAPEDGQPFLPYTRDDLLSRPWAVPGTPGLEHRIGGIEKKDGSGAISYDPANHQHMVELRARKVENARRLIPPLEVDGPETGDLLVLSWGGTMGACREAVEGASRGGGGGVRPGPGGGACASSPPASDAGKSGRGTGALPQGAGARTEHRATGNADPGKLPGHGGAAEQDPGAALHGGGSVERDSRIDSSGNRRGGHGMNVPTKPEMAPEPVPADYATDQEVRWCPGCGDFAILNQMKKVLASLKARRENAVQAASLTTSTPTGCTASMAGPQPSPPG